MMSFYEFSVESLRNTLVNHCWWLIWLTFVFSVLYALHDHRELSQKMKEAAGKEGQAARRKRSLLWCLPVLALIGATVAQWGSDKADKEIASLGKHLQIATNQQAKAQAWPFLESHVPVLVDWLPWNHTFGGNHNFNLVLRNGGTLYIDAGRPLPSEFFAKTRLP